MAFLKEQGSNFVSAERLVSYYTHFVYIWSDDANVVEVSQTYVLYAFDADMILCKNCSIRVG